MKKNVHPIVPVSICASLLYIILAVKPLSREIQFQTEWTVNCSLNSELLKDKDIKSEDVIPFKMGQTAGYFTEDGIITSLVTFPYKAAVSQKDYALYDTGSESIQIFSSSGEKTGTITEKGFPFFQDDRKFIMFPGGNSFGALNPDGTLQWQHHNFAPLTAFSSSPAGVAAGYADGTIITFNNQGKVLQNYIPGGSEYPIILGTALSSDGKYLASVCGMKQQRFVLAKCDKGLTTAVYHEYLPSETNRQMTVKFNNDTSRCYFSNNEGLGVLNLHNLKADHIPVKGTILSIKEIDDEKAVFVLSRKNDRFYVSLIENYEHFSGSFSFKADHAFIAVNNNSLFVGRDSSISRIKVIHK